MILFISEFLDLKKIFFYQHSYESAGNLSQLFLYLNSAKGRLNVPTALGHMLMPAAQR